jgi:Histidine kinase-, DNA gyrase B-, and HSP90-like ATPase
LLEFFSEKELAMQIGHQKQQWPLALLKELVDNALDASALAGIAPEVTVTIERDAFSVQDNGPGLPVETLKRSLDYLIRVSDKAQIVNFSAAARPSGPLQTGPAGHVSTPGDDRLAAQAADLSGPSVCGDVRDG